MSRIATQEKKKKVKNLENFTQKTKEYETRRDMYYTRSLAPMIQCAMTRSLSESLVYECPIFARQSIHLFFAYRSRSYLLVRS